MNRGSRFIRLSQELFQFLLRVVSCEASWDKILGDLRALGFQFHRKGLPVCDVLTSLFLSVCSTVMQ